MWGGGEGSAVVGTHGGCGVDGGGCEDGLGDLGCGGGSGGSLGIACTGGSCGGLRIIESRQKVQEMLLEEMK